MGQRVEYLDDQIDRAEASADPSVARGTRIALAGVIAPLREGSTADAARARSLAQRLQALADAERAGVARLEAEREQLATAGNTFMARLLAQEERARGRRVWPAWAGAGDSWSSRVFGA